ncbi:hypothetical protein N9165_00680 [Akkermansiaceae bacterium]|nr:hypothetical protein [Akkermansiaceae bacterium]
MKLISIPIETLSGNILSGEENISCARPKDEGIEALDPVFPGR